MQSETEKEETRIRSIVSRISFRLFGTVFNMYVVPDKKFGGRLYIQVRYSALCTQTGKQEVWSGRKWYLSDHMLDDEVVKTCYAACRAAAEHEAMEAFKVDGVVLFNPHTSFEELLKVSHKEVTREKHQSLQKEGHKHQTDFQVQSN
jgi:hypothetical protein